MDQFTQPFSRISDSRLEWQPAKGSKKRFSTPQSKPSSGAPSAPSNVVHDIEPPVQAPDKPQQAPATIADYACRSVEKSFKKIIRHEAKVLGDRDIEALHQMRIGLRRLRTTIQTFESVFDFPDCTQEATLKPLAKRLGRVRDLDVLLLALRREYRPQLPKKERKALDKILARLQKQRDRRFKQMQHCLKSPYYKALKANIRSWTKDPVPPEKPTAALSIPMALPDLLLPVLSQTLLHPGWFASPDATAEIGNGAWDRAEATQGVPHLQQATVTDWLDHQGLILHDLRKRIKQLRYQTEFFASLYDEPYQRQVKEFKTIQDTLGTLQDAWVLNQTLTRTAPKIWPKRLSSMAEQIQQDRWQAWQQWEGIRLEYGQEDKRSHLRQMLLHPVNS